MPPKKKEVKDDINATQEAWEDYIVNSVADNSDLEYQPYSAPLRDTDEVQKTSIVDRPGGGVDIKENGKTRSLIPNPAAGGRLTEADGDTFTKTLYSDGGVTEGFLNDDARVLAMRQSVIMYRDDPMYRAVIDGFVYFIIGKGLKFKARDENPDVQEHLESFWKENKMDGRDSEIVRRFLKFGEILIRYFTKGAAGAEAAAPRVRLIPFWRVDELKYDSKDPEKIVHIKTTPYSEGATSFEPEMVLGDDLQYVNNSENEASRGEPPFLVVMRACKWYADFMLNRVVLNRYRTAFVLFKKLIGSGPGRVSEVSSASTNATKKGLGGKLEKRLPKPGTVVTHNASIEYEWKSPTTGAGDASQDAKEIRGYVAAGAMVPEFLLGDASQANQDNSLVSDNPFVRKVESYQDFFESVFGEMLKRVIEQGIRSGKLPKTSTETTITESGAIMRRVRKVLHRLGIKEATADGDLAQKRPVPTKTEVDFVWPNLIQKNELDQARTLQLDQMMGAVSLETIRGKRGYDHAVEEMRLQKEYESGGDQTERDRQAEIDDDGADEKTKNKGQDE